MQNLTAGESLRILMKREGIKQLELAEKLNLDKRTVSHTIRLFDTNKGTIKTLVEYAEAVGYELEIGFRKMNGGNNMIYEVKNWVDFLEANSKEKDDLLDYLDGFNEDVNLINIVKDLMDFTEEENEELVRCICDMMVYEDPAIKSMTYKRVLSGFEIKEVRRDGR